MQLVNAMSCRTHFLELPQEDGGTQCYVMILLRGALPPVVIVSEAPENEGFSVTLAFDAIAKQVNQDLLRGAQEVLWLEHWPERSLAAWALRRDPIAATHLMIHEAGRWERLPMNASEVARLLTTGRMEPGD